MMFRSRDTPCPAPQECFHFEMTADLFRSIPCALDGDVPRSAKVFPADKNRGFDAQLFASTTLSRHTFLVCHGASPRQTFLTSCSNILPHDLCLPSTRPRRLPPADTTLTSGLVHQFPTSGQPNLTPTPIYPTKARKCQRKWLYRLR